MKKRFIFKVPILFLSYVFLLVTIPLLAFSENPPFNDFSRVVVTATRFPEKKKKLPVKVTVISEDDIAKSSASSLAELLNLKLPLYVKESPGLTGTVWIRGMKSDEMGAFLSSRVLVLLNGHPAGTGVLDTIPLLSVKQIEVIAGPFSVAYGSGALAGVVNIMTVKKQNPGIQTEIALGSFGYQKADIQTGFEPTKGLSIVLAGGIEARKDYQVGTTRVGEPQKYSQKTYQNTGYEYQKAYGAFHKQSESWFLEGSLQYFRTDHAGTPNQLLANDLNDYLNFSHFGTDSTLGIHLSENLFFSTSLYLNQNRRSNYGIAPPFSFEFHQNLAEAGILPQWKIRFGEMEWSLGGNFNFLQLKKQNQGGGYQEPRTRYLAGGVFLENHTEALCLIHLWLGARYDFYWAEMEASPGISSLSLDKETRFDHWSSRIGFSLPVKNFILKFYSGTGFTAPSVMQLTGEYTGPFGDYKGNPNLKPETSFSYQITGGYERVHQFLLTYGYQTIDDRIILVTENTWKTYRNQKQVVFRFLELDSLLNWGNLLSLRNFNASLAFRGTWYLKIRDEETWSEPTSVYLPKQKTTTALEIVYYRLLHFSVEHQWTGTLKDGASGIDIGQFHLLHAHLELTPFLFLESEEKYRSLRFRFEIRNLLDYEYEYVDGYPLPGREFRFGMSYRYDF